MFGLFKKKTKTTNPALLNGNFLGKAADAKHKALQAVKNKEFDKAWKMFHEQKVNYMQHAAWAKFTRLQTLRLDGSVSENLANVLRLEGKHSQALVHVVYWIASSREITKTQKKKLGPYLNRTGLKNITESQVWAYIKSIKTNPDYRFIQAKVNEWINDG